MWLLGRTRNESLAHAAATKKFSMTGGQGVLKEMIAAWTPQKQ
jgi:hypothetical protein